MSCYMRHLGEILDEAGIVATKENRKAVDQAIHKIVEVQYKNCPEAWKEVKKRIQADPKAKKEFIAALKKAVA